MNPTGRTLTPSARLAAQRLGMAVRAGRRARRWTQAQLAERVGVSVVTIGKVERGDPSVALGTAYEAAALVGVDLLGPGDPSPLDTAQRTWTSRRRASASAGPRAPIDDDF